MYVYSNAGYILFHRYSDVVNTAVENVLNSCETDEKKAAIMSFLNVSALSERHQLISTNSKSLVLSLNHPQPSVRRSAVQFMMKNKDQVELAYTFQC